MQSNEDLTLSLEIVMTKESIEDLRSRFFLVEDKERWSACETMWCCKECSERKGSPSPCRCSEVEVVTSGGEITIMPTRITCDVCGAYWKPDKVAVRRK